MSATQPPPTPAAVRAAMKPPGVSCTDEEERAFMQEKRFSRDIIIDHIRAIAQEMREHAEHAEHVAAVISKVGADVLYNYANDLRKFADKLEGK